MGNNISLLSRNPAWHCSPQIPISLGSTLKCELVTRWLHWTEPLKSWESRWTPTSPSALSPVTVSRASRTLNVMKTLAGSNWGFTTGTLMASYKIYVRPIVNYATSIWFTLVSSMHLDKLDVIHNKALMIVSGCHLKAATSHFRVETGVLPLRAHLELSSQ